MVRTIIVWMLFGLLFVNLACIMLLLWRHYWAFMRYLRENHERILRQWKDGPGPWRS